MGSVAEGVGNRIRLSAEHVFDTMGGALPAILSAATVLVMACAKERRNRTTNPDERQVTRTEGGASVANSRLGVKDVCLAPDTSK